MLRRAYGIIAAITWSRIISARPSANHRRLACAAFVGAPVLRRCGVGGHARVVEAASGGNINQAMNNGVSRAGKQWPEPGIFALR